MVSYFILMKPTFQEQRQKQENKGVYVHAHTYTHTHTHTHTHTRMSNSSRINGEDEIGNVMVKRQVEIKGNLSWVTRGGLYAEVLLCRGLLSRRIWPWKKLENHPSRENHRSKGPEHKQASRGEKCKDDPLWMKYMAQGGGGYKQRLDRWAATAMQRLAPVHKHFALDFRCHSTGSMSSKIQK